MTVIDIILKWQVLPALLFSFGSFVVAVFIGNAQLYPAFYCGGSLVILAFFSYSFVLIFICAGVASLAIRWIFRLYAGLSLALYTGVILMLVVQSRGCFVPLEF